MLRAVVEHQPTVTVARMASTMADPVFLITGASTGIGAATARQRPRPATGSCSPRAPRTS